MKRSIKNLQRIAFLQRVAFAVFFITVILISAYSETARKIITAIVDFIISKIVFVIPLLVISPFIYKIYCRWRLYVPIEPSFVLVRKGSLEFRGGERTDTRKFCNTFAISIYLVMNEQYKQFINATDHRAPLYWNDNDYPTNKGKHPVVGVTREDAESYCDWYSALSEGRETYRLPSELEWERAARGTRGWRFPWSRQQFSERKCNSAESGIGDTTPVDYYDSGRSSCGCYDMVGNVSEWTSSNDEYGLTVVRGSSYETDRERSNCFFRILLPPDAVSDSIGFRVAREDNSRDS